MQRTKRLCAAIGATGSILCLAGAVLLVTPAAAQGGGYPCAADCDENDVVVVSELITCVNIFLGRNDMESCRPCDGNGDHQVTINELVAGVINAQNGCSA